MIKITEWFSRRVANMHPKIVDCFSNHLNNDNFLKKQHWFNIADAFIVQMSPWWIGRIGSLMDKELLLSILLGCASHSTYFCHGSNLNAYLSIQ